MDWSITDMVGSGLLLVVVVFFTPPKPWYVFWSQENDPDFSLSDLFCIFSTPLCVEAEQCDITDYSVENPLLFHITAEIMVSVL